jgi:hypothetical protein
MTFRHIKHALASVAALVAFLAFGSAAAMDLNAAAIDVLKADPDVMSAVKLPRGNGKIFCTLGKDVQGAMVADNDRTAVLSSPEFRAWHGRGNVTTYAEVRAGINELLLSMQNGRCNVAVESASNIIALSGELKREGMIFLILPSPIRSAQLAELYAKSLGFSSNADLLLATHMMANNEELKSYYKLGITSKAAYDDAVARMRLQAYSQNTLDLMGFLKDEAEGALRNVSAVDVRDERKSSAGSPVQ